MSGVYVVDEQDDPLPSGDYGTLAAGVLAAEAMPPGTELTLHFVSPERIAALNAEHLGRSGPTDVLSFPLEDLVPGVAPPRPAGGPPLLVGDVVICPGYIRNRALGQGVPFPAEMALMVVHGTLHLLGYDHQVDSEAELMEARERSLLSALAPAHS